MTDPVAVRSVHPVMAWVVIDDNLTDLTPVEAAWVHVVAAYANDTYERKLRGLPYSHPEALTTIARAQLDEARNLLDQALDDAEVDTDTAREHRNAAWLFGALAARELGSDLDGASQTIDGTNV